MRIGLAVIVGKEEELIDNFISKNKLSDLFLEIKFLCDEVKDHTYDKLKEFEREEGLCMVYRRNLNFNFAEQRNYLNNFMRSDYILRLDVDEVMNEKLIDWIKNFNGKKDAYEVLRQERFEGEFKSYTPIVFLFKNKKEIMWKNRIHEIVIGYKSKEVLPEECFIIHDKNQNRCAKQNRFYYENFEEQRKIVGEPKDGFK